MSTPSLASASLRPAVLPPTLQPNAIAAMAPPTSRGLSALLATGLYAFLGGGGFLAVHLMPAAISDLHVTTPPETVFNPVVSLLQDKPVPPPAQPRTNSNQPVASEPAVAQPSTENPPADPPKGFSEVDHSQNRDYAPHQPNGVAPTRESGDPRAGSANDDLRSRGVLEIPAASVRILSQITPAYPALARAARIQGPVLLHMTIDAQGIPTDVQVTSGHPALQAEAVKAARLWRFVAASVNGQAVPATFQLTILFALR